MLDYIRILRPHQWYKNLIVFLALIYSGNLFNVPALVFSALGLVSLCLVSSASYILNDLFDRQYDKKHPCKSRRPIARGRIKAWRAVALAGLLAGLAFALGFYVSPKFFYLLAGLFVLTQLYSVILKSCLFLDILTIGVNFVIRAVSGAYIIGVYVSPWLVLCPFFLSLFLSAGKRRAESGSTAFKPVLRKYTRPVTSALMIVTTTVLIVSYSLYIISVHPWLMVTLPVALYGIFLYLHFAYNEPETAKYPFLIFKDYRMVLTLVGWAIITVIVLY